MIFSLALLTHTIIPHASIMVSVTYLVFVAAMVLHAAAEEGIPKSFFKF